MRYIFILTLLVSFLFSNDAIKLPKKLEQKVQIYKKAKINRDFKTLYNLQVPYFKYLYPFSLYKAYENGFLPMENVKITKIKEKKEKKYTLIAQFMLKKKKNMVYYDLNWYEIEGEYYLFTEDVVLFKK